MEVFFSLEGPIPSGRFPLYVSLVRWFYSPRKVLLSNITFQSLVDSILLCCVHISILHSSPCTLSGFFLFVWASVLPYSFFPAMKLKLCVMCLFLRFHSSAWVPILSKRVPFLHMGSIFPYGFHFFVWVPFLKLSSLPPYAFHSSILVPFLWIGSIPQ